jgi:hypothetical protein
MWPPVNDTEIWITDMYPTAIPLPLIRTDKAPCRRQTPQPPTPYLEGMEQSWAYLAIYTPWVTGRLCTLPPPLLSKAYTTRQLAKCVLQWPLP